MISAEVLEALMLICFGWAWPVAIAKTLKVRKVHGKSIVFLFLILLGYLSGIAGKVIRAQGGMPNWVTALYLLNAVMVTTEIVLYFRFRRPDDVAGVTIEPEPPVAEVIEDQP